MQRAGQSVQASREGVIGVRKRGANQVRGMCADVAALVVGMDDEVQARQVFVTLVLHAHHLGEVSAPIQAGVHLRDFAAVILQIVDKSRDDRQLSGQVQAVLQHRLPVLLLAHTFVIAPGEFGLGLQRLYRQREERHRVGFLGHGAQRIVDVLRNRTAPGPLGFDCAGLLLGRNLAHQQQVIQSANERHFRAAWLGQLRQNFRDGVAAKTDALCRVHVRDVRHHDFGVAHPAIDLTDGDLVHHHVAVFLDQLLDARAPFRELCGNLIV